MKILSFIAAAVLIVFSLSSAQVNQDFRLVNETGVTIHRFFVAPVMDTENWGPDLLNGSPLESGQSIDVTFDKSDFPDDCVWNMAVLDKEGNSLSWYNIDLCQWYTITLHWDAGKSEGWAEFSESLNGQTTGSSDSGSLSEMLVLGSWKMMLNGESYGTLTFSSDGSVVKKAAGMSMESSGSWQLNGNNLTLNFPDEGDPYSGTLTVHGNDIQAAFMEGAITYLFQPE